MGKAQPGAHEDSVPRYHRLPQGGLARPGRPPDATAGRALCLQGAGGQADASPPATMCHVAGWRG
eukprot:14336247-Alexandrium_andersonii.AAC.1